MIDNAKQIMQAADIVAVIQEYAPTVKLEKKGSNWVAPCPFHNEKTGSFTVSPSKGIYKCFGCQAGGDAADFLQNHLGVTFPEALEKLSIVGKVKPTYKEGANVEKWKDEQKKQRELKESLLAFLKLSLDHYAANPVPFETVIEKNGVGEDETLVLVAGRKYRPETVAKFNLLPPADNNYLTDYAKSQKWDMAKLSTIGVVNAREDGSHFDVLRSRTLFPIHDHTGAPVALAGRLQPGSTAKAAKYINLKENPLYSKKSVLYGFHLARKSVQSTETIYLVEGYTDVLTCSEYGMENVVATCGTALTAEQCQLMQKFGIVTVVLFRDGDRAGLEATKKDVVTLIKAGLQPRVLLCDDGHDPDSQVRLLGEKGFRGFREKEEDGLIWLVMENHKKGDPVAEAAAIDLAAELISYLPDTAQDTYLRALTSGNRLGSVRKTIERGIAKIKASRKPKNRNDRYDLESEQSAEAMAYGIYKSENAYWRWQGDGEAVQITNFIIVPKYLIKDPENPARIVQITNIYGHSAVLNVDTAVFGTMQKLKDEIAKHGNFIFEPGAKGEDFNRIVKMIYDEMNDAAAYSIIALGYHPRGFYAWCNCITTPNGDPIFCDDLGLVEYEGTKFLLPGRGYQNEDENFDISGEDDRHIKMFRYTEGQCISFEEWTEKFIEVYGQNGMMGIAWYMATLFRDAIFPINKCFPLLNGFGKKGKGKSTMLWSLGYMFGDARLAGILGVSTYTSFFRSFMQVSNAVVWWDEFHDKLDLKTWIKPMMGVWDGNGRNLGNIKSSHGTSQTPVRAGFAYTGQDIPINNDGALASRSITLHFNYERTPEAEKNLSALRKIEQSGLLSQITVQVLKHREKVERLFDITFSEVKNDVVTHLSNRMMGADVESRTLINHLIPVTIFKILEPELGFCFSYLDLVDFTCELIEGQSALINSNDDTGQFWKAVEFLVNQNRVRHDREISVESTASVRRVINRKETELLNYEPEKTIIFLRLNDVHALYQKQMREVGRDSLELPTLSHYLENHPAFIGVCKAKKFNKNRETRSCWMFAADMLEGVEFMLTVEAISHYGDDEDDTLAEQPKEKLPF